MIQRYLFDLLTQGKDAILANSKLLDDIFERDYALDATEVAAIKTAFANDPPTIINGYARQDTDFPCYAIVLGGEGESVTFLGDSAGQIDDETDPLYRADIDSSVWDHNYNIFIYTEHPDLTAYYYEIAKSIMVAGFRTLANVGALFNFTLSGTELAPDPAYLPEHLHVRQLAFKCSREFQYIDRDSLLSKAFQIAGIHVDKTGSPSSVGGVKTLVTTYDAEG